MKIRSQNVRLATILLAVTSLSLADEIDDFTSDGCSSFPDGTVAQRELWRSCCVVHDLAYWQGGTAEQRMAADKALKVCVTEVGEPTIAELMLAGVRVGGTPWIPSQFRWGYGWPYLRGYKQLSEDEVDMVEKKIQAAMELLEAQQSSSTGDSQ